jgi:hypothetical protein
MFPKLTSMKRHLLGGTAVVAILLTLSACTTTVSGTAKVSDSGQQQKAPRPPDRDEQGVTAALRQLDACKLIAGFVRTHAGTAAIPNGPHSCLLSGKADYTPGDESLTVSVGDKFDHGDRFMMKPLDVDGVKAYLLDTSTGNDASCQVTIPVSFERGVSVTFDLGGKVDACKVAQNVAKSVVAGLRAPDQNALDATTRPFALWDGCAFIHALLDAGTYEPEGTPDPLSGCQNTDASVIFEVSYTIWDTTGKAGLQQVAGKPASLSPRPSGGCTSEWDQGPSGTGNKWLGEAVFHFSSGEDCAAAAAIVQKAIVLASQPPPADPAKPVRPLFYLTSEPDEAPPGACLDFAASSSDDCQPYQEVAVPQDTEQKMTLPLTNKNVQCAMFNAAVKAVFGPSLQPLTWAAHGFYVEPTHTLEIMVDVDSQDAPAPYGMGDNLYTDRQITQIAGKQAVTFFSGDNSAYDVYVSPYNDLNRKGNLHIELRTHPARGDGQTITVPLDSAKPAQANQVMAQVVRTYFP